MAIIIRSIGTQEPVQPRNGTDFGLTELQTIVGGRFEIAHLDDGRIMVLNEEGKLEELPVNEEATRLYLRGRAGFDLIIGDVLVCADNEVC